MPDTGKQMKNLASMGVSYGLGTFNDNFFKQAALLLAAVYQQSEVQANATILFALPFVVFSAWAGWLADRLNKKHLVVSSKVLELAAMLTALLSLVLMNWTMVLAVIFIMGLQSTIFSPALNGSIPELFPAAQVPRVNALLKMATTVTILMGIALAGIPLDMDAPAFLSGLLPEGERPFGRVLIGVIAVLVSVVGIIASLRIAGREKPNAPNAPFPLLGPVDSFAHAAECLRYSPALFVSLVGEAVFYGVSSFVVVCIANLGVNALHISPTVTSLLSAALMIGVAAGALYAGRRPAIDWLTLVFPAYVFLGIGLLFSGLAIFFPTPLALVYLFIVFLFTGVSGGIYLIPLVSNIQLMPPAGEKGKTLGISNFGSFSAIIISGVFLHLLGRLNPAALLSGCGLAMLLCAIPISRAIKKIPGVSLVDQAKISLAGFIVRGLLSLRYRVRATGLDTIQPGGPFLILPNHPGLMDPVIIMSLLYGLRPRPLGDQAQLGSFFGKIAARLMNAVIIPDIRRDGISARDQVRAGMDTIMAALRQGDSVLFYPSGRIYRSRHEKIGSNSGVARIISGLNETGHLYDPETGKGVRILLARMSGLWGSSFSYAGARKAPHFTGEFLRGIRSVLLNLIMFTPRRRIDVEFVEALPAQLYEVMGIDRSAPSGKTAHSGKARRALNAWLDDFYNAVSTPPTAVPRHFLLGRKARQLPEYEESDQNGPEHSAGNWM